MSIRVFSGASRSQKKELELPNITSYLSDLMSTDSASGPMTCGLFRMSASEPLIKG